MALVPVPCSCSLFLYPVPVPITRTHHHPLPPITRVPHDHHHHHHHDVSESMRPARCTQRCSPGFFWKVPIGRSGQNSAKPLFYLFYQFIKTDSFKGSLPQVYPVLEMDQETVQKPLFYHCFTGPLCLMGPYSLIR